MQYIITLLIAGAIGNLIDRIVNGYVVDFLYFKLIDFPVFNVADCYVTIACALLIIFCVFVINDKEFNAIFSLKKDFSLSIQSAPLRTINSLTLCIPFL